MFGYADRPHTGTTSSVRRRESLMQVQVADVSPDRSRIGQADLCVHIGAVHIELTAAGVDNVAHFLDVHFKDTVSRRICDHAGSQIILVGFSLCAEVFEVDISFVVTLHRDSREAALDGACRVCPVGGSRKQNDIAMSLSDAFQISADHAQACIFAGRTRIGLERATLEACNFTQVSGQVLNQFFVAFHLVFRCVRMDIHKFRTTERQHAGSRIQLHGAGT